MKTTTVENESVPVFKCAFLVGDPGGAKPTAPVTLQQLAKTLTLDFAVCIDTTGSMGPWIEGTKKVVQQVSERIGDIPGLDGRCRFSLVLFRDTGDEYETQVACDFVDGESSDEFLARVHEVKVDGGGDGPEQVAEGALVAVKKLSWSPQSMRHLLLIGDAPNQVDGKAKASIASVIAAAQPTVTSTDLQGRLNHITIHGLRVGEMLDETKDPAFHDFAKLAQGADGGSQGLIKALGDDVDGFVDLLVSELMKKVEIADAIVGGDAKKAEKAVDADPHAGGIGGILKYLGDRKITTPEFAEGFVAEADFDGNTCVEPLVLVTRSELKAFRAGMNLCVAAFELSLIHI